MTAKTQKGSCHCGDVRFTASIDLNAPSFRCNCSICTKSRSWISPISVANFALNSGSDSLTEYRFGAEAITHFFCRRCGVKTHGKIKGKHGEDELIAVSVQCLDVAPEGLDSVPRIYVDGRSDHHDREPAITANL